jgi:preprotein translocase subunit YajC
MCGGPGGIHQRSQSGFRSPSLSQEARVYAAVRASFGKASFGMMQNTIQIMMFQGGGAGGGLGMILLLPLLFIFATFYFQQRKTKRWQQVIGTLKKGDRVTTGGGIRGTVTEVKDDAVWLKVPPDYLRLEIVKSSVVSINREEEEKKS